MKSVRVHLFVTSAVEHNTQSFWCGFWNDYAGTKKAPWLFRKPPKFMTAWFDNKYVAMPARNTAELSAMHPIPNSHVVKNSPML